jgi:hypothetical protein
VHRHEVIRCINCGYSSVVGRKDDEDLALSMVVGMVTDSTVLGFLAGGSLLGAMLGDSMSSSDSDSSSDSSSSSSD